MTHQLFCPEEKRKAEVRARAKTGGTINGIDYLEVVDHDAPDEALRQRTLLVHCFLPVTALDENNVRIDGGISVGPIRVVWAGAASNVLADLPTARLTTAEKNVLNQHLSSSDSPRVLVVRTDRSGDYSTYTVRLVAIDDPDEPAPGFDRLLSSVAFSFKVECEQSFDCKPILLCPEPILPAPQIDYLAKDYNSFRRLLLDRLAVTMPDWKERNPADVGITLVEVLAYVADQLSYQQDAVATEAYLGTSRRRVSVRRHARLLDYFLHDGANARAWICFEVESGSAAEGALLNAGTPILSKDSGAIVFETLHEVKLRAQRSAIPFYTWGDTRCCLPKGATSATLLGGASELGLLEGDVLLFEEVRGPRTGLKADADPAHRHAVRLNRPPVERIDPLDPSGRKVLEISWHTDDALPFSLCLWQIDGQPVSVAHGNVALADHGQTIAGEELPPVPSAPDRFQPQLARPGLTHALPYDDREARGQSAAAALETDRRRVLPHARLQSDGETWEPMRDLLNSDRFATEFVVEMESDGRAHLRFGDGTLGRRPGGGAVFKATYRVGNGRAGNVGADALTRVANPIQGLEVRNPMPATGGTDPEPIEQVRLDAPQAFRTQERAVTEEDYAAAAQRHPDVQRAAATRRWTGSWHTMFVTVDRRGGRRVTAEFEQELRAFLERFRLAGYDLEIDAPRFVSLDVKLMACLLPGYFRSQVKQALFETFSNADLPDGRRGFFHPDNFTFGQAVYLSQTIAAAMRVAGLAWVKPLVFQRLGHPADKEIEIGQIPMGRLEIARLDQDPNGPENGKIDFEMHGGL